MPIVSTDIKIKMSTVAGAKAMQERGWLTEYRWAFGLDDVLESIARLGPAVLGLQWYEGMMAPDHLGWLHVRGDLVGGHAILARGVSVSRRYVRVRNSWGRGWGQAGDCLLSWDDLGRLLDEQGECAVPIRASGPMPTPAGS